MTNYSPLSQVLDSVRSAVPYPLKPAALNAHRLLKTDPGSLAVLEDMQAFSKRNSPVWVGAPSWSEEDPWRRSLRVGMTLARRHLLHLTFAGRVYFRDAMRAETHRRGLRTNKPYNLHSVWYLFVEGVSPETSDKTLIAYLGQKSLEEYLIVWDTLQEGAERAAAAVCEAIHYLEESGFAEPDLQSSME